MELALQKYGNYEKFEQATGGSLLTKSRIWYQVKKYMEKEGCLGEVRHSRDTHHITQVLSERFRIHFLNAKYTRIFEYITAFNSTLY